MENDMNDYGLTDKQILVIKKVERAMNEAKKCGVGFWDNYGNLTAYNRHMIYQPVPDDTNDEELDINSVYTLSISNFGPGNADDPLFIKRVE